MREGEESKPEEGLLAGNLLVAMPSLGDPNFTHSVIYLCSHSPDGAMGLIINRPVESPNFKEVLGHFDIALAGESEARAIHLGGPVEQGKGFILHTDDYHQETSIVVQKPFVLTSSIDILRDLAAGKGPRRSLVALGYAGWGAGQLDEEIRENVWLIVKASEEIIFKCKDAEKWSRAIAVLDSETGEPIDPTRISPVAGNA